MRQFFLLVSSLFLLFGQANAQEQFAPTEKALLWKISGNGLSKPSYLYGTIHIIPKADVNFSDNLLSALEKSKQVTFEIDMKEMTSMSTQFSLITKAFMSGGKTLRDLLSPEDYTFVKEKMSEKGMAIGMFEKMKPMFLSMMMSSDEESSTASNVKMTSVEMELYKHVKKQKTPTAGLETAAYQMSVFDSIPYQEQAQMLVDGLRSGEQSNDEFDKMMEYYQAQDIQALQNVISEEGAGMANFEDRLLTRRNLNWIPIMSRMMHDKPTFFAVGAGHLGGPKGVIALLRAEGFKVTAVDPSE